ncbi:MAG: hypothetical protein K2M43_02930 [Mycoplasmoidaceae bacterium]|nr:hypothetical protein [Mycoplasmoidaceae bacterium]
MLAIFSGFYSYKSCLECFSKKNRNDNLIYHFTFSFSLIIIIVYAILFILDLFLIKYYGHTSFFDSFKYFLQANGDLKAPLYG